MITPFAENVAAIADLLRAVAWPAAFLFVVFRYKDHVGRLIDRLREGGPAKFDPIPQQPTKPTASIPSSAPGNPAVSTSLASIRTPAVVEMEKLIEGLPAVTNDNDPTSRNATLITLAAKAVIVSQFERAEANIYASQLDLLHYLNSRAGGEAPSRLKELFYDPARNKFPDVYKSYAFEAYLQFLAAAFFIANTGTQVAITAMGREYLLWRVEQSRPPRVIG
jgi:hypothetical protein